MLDWIFFLLIVGFLGLGYLVRFSLPHFIKRKTENFAQKQDLAELTRIAGSINSKFDRLNVVHRVQFEAEFRHFQDVWLAAHKASMYFVRLYPVMDGLRTVTKEHFDEFVAACFSFAQALDASKPFISGDVWKAFYDFEDLMIDAKTRDFTATSSVDVQRHREEARLAFDRCAAAIQKRLSDTLVV